MRQMRQKNKKILLTTNIIFGIKQTSKKCETIVIQMVINNLWRFKCEKNWKNLNMIEWRIIANKTRKCCQKNQDTMTTNIIFGIKQL